MNEITKNDRIWTIGLFFPEDSALCVEAYSFLNLLDLSSQYSKMEQIIINKKRIVELYNASIKAIHILNRFHHYRTEEDYNGIMDKKFEEYYITEKNVYLNEEAEQKIIDEKYNQSFHYCKYKETTNIINDKLTIINVDRVILKDKFNEETLVDTA